MQRLSCFLVFNPSQIAAASLLFSINIGQSELAKRVLGVQQIPRDDLEVKIRYELEVHTDTITTDEAMDFSVESNSIGNGPLRLWTVPIEELTNVQKERDVEPIYKLLVDKLNEVCYEGILTSDESLFIK